MTSEERVAEVYGSMMDAPRCQACFALLGYSGGFMLCHDCLVKWYLQIDGAPGHVTHQMYEEIWDEWLQQQQSLRF